MVLVVDDIEVNNFYISEILKSIDIECECATSGIEAIEKCKNGQNINLILMDIQMPDMDGVETLKEIKKILPNLPVIAQTAYALIGDREKFMALGCDDYLSKPIDPELLKKTVLKYLSN